MNPHPMLFTILLLGAALLSAVPAEARAELLPEGTRPPVFTLLDIADKPVPLRSYLGGRRIVLLFGPSTSYLETIQSERTQFEERDLTVLAVVPPDGPQVEAPHAGPIHVLRDPGGIVARQYGAADGKAAFYLVGKDGHIALARHGYPTPRELFGVIDTMPMRRREMRERRHHP